MYSLYCIELAALYRKCISTGDWSKCVERVGILLSCHQLMKTMMIFDQNHYHLNLMMKKMGTIPLIIKQQGVETDQLAADIYPNSIPGTPKYFTTYISPFISKLYTNLSKYNQGRQHILPYISIKSINTVCIIFRIIHHITSIFL